MFSISYKILSSPYAKNLVPFSNIFRNGSINSQYLNMTDKPYKVLVTHPEVPQEALDLLATKCEVILCESIPPTKSEILQKVRGVDGIYWRCKDALNLEVINAAGPQLKAITTVSAGINSVDVEELKRRNIPLGHTPDVPNNAVANLAMGLLLAAARRFPEGRQAVDEGIWGQGRYQWLWGQDIEDATVGFFGFGGISQTIAKRLQAFDVRNILYNSRKPVDSSIERKFNAAHVSFDEMLSKSDIVFVAAPLTNETKGIFDATAFGKMKRNAIFINIARGQIVNQTALFEALKTHQIFAAGIDVMVPEPLPANDPLISLPNLVITPHLGTATCRTRLNMC